MTNFIIQHRKSEQIYQSENAAKSAINEINDGLDGEIVLSRYEVDGKIKSAIGLCHKDEGGKYSWSIHSYDDEQIDEKIASVAAGDVDISGYIKINDFSIYSSTTNTTINSKLSKTDFDSYKTAIDSELTNKVAKTTYETYTATTKSTLQNLETVKADKTKTVASGEIKDEHILLKNSNGDVVSSIDIAELYEDGMVDDVRIENGDLVIIFNTESGAKDIYIDLEEIFNPSNYYTKDEVDEKTVTFDTYDEYDVAQKNNDTTYFIKDDRIIARGGIEYQSMMRWAKFLDTEEDYMPIAVYNESNSNIEVYLGSEIEEMNSVEGLTPIGVVVIPKEHDVYNTGEGAAMSLVSMSYETPDVGNLGKTIGEGNDEDYMLFFGHSGHGITVETVQLPSLGEFQKGIIHNVPQASVDGKCHLPTDDTSVGNGQICPTDNTTRYPTYTETSRTYAPSPYDGEERNPVYYSNYSSIITANTLSKYNGVEMTSKFIDKVQKPTDWKTTEQLTNSNDAGYYPTICACWRYHTEGTNQGDWYLPSIAELGYLGPRIKKIGETLDFINKKFDKSYTTPIGTGDSAKMQNMWSSTLKASSTMMTFSTFNYSFASRSVNSVNSNDNYDLLKSGAQCRAFLKISY